MANPFKPSMLPLTYTKCCDPEIYCVECPILSSPDCSNIPELKPGQLFYCAEDCTFYYNCNGTLTPLNLKAGAGLAITDNVIYVNISPDVGFGFTEDGQLTVDCAKLIAHCSLATKAEVNSKVTGVGVSGGLLTVAGTPTAPVIGLTCESIAANCGFLDHVTVSAPLTGDGTPGNPLGIEAGEASVTTDGNGIEGTGTTADPIRLNYGEICAGLEAAGCGGGSGGTSIVWMAPDGTYVPPLYRQVVLHRFVTGLTRPTGTDYISPVGEAYWAELDTPDTIKHSPIAAITCDGTGRPTGFATYTGVPEPG